jgi:signal transduction histidine kinase/ActR/RegA family two-component response regulator
MSTDSDIGRLNVLLELLTECAEATDLAMLLRATAGRVRWVLEFQRCTLALADSPMALADSSDVAYWTVTRDRDRLEPVAADVLPPEHRAMIERVLRLGTPRASGPPVSSLCHPLDAHGERIGALCFSDDQNAYGYRDTRYAHHIAQVLASTIARLRQVETIRRQNAEVQSANRAKDEFLAILGHELRNPLAPILLAVELLARRTADAPFAEVAVIKRQAEHVCRLVDDLLDVSRFTSGKLELDRAPVEISRVVTSAVETTSQLFEKRQQRLDIEVPATGLCVDGDESRLVQVLSNLLTNASRYTDPGGHVQVVARPRGREVVIDVIDNGCGLGAELLPQVFDMFVQAPRDRSPRTGLGLGLAIVKSLTELHGGTVSASSEGANRGSTFTVTLPRVAAGLPVAPTPARPAAPCSRHRILLVDDNRESAEQVSQLLESEGHHVVVLHDAAETLSKLEELRPDVALIDIGLPAMDGYQLAREIRLRLGNATPYLIAYSGYGQLDDRKRSRAAGFDSHLVKPAQAHELLAAVDRRNAPAKKPVA